MNETMMRDAAASLEMMWKGMLGLFLVCGGIALLMMIITHLTKGRKPPKP